MPSTYSQLVPDRRKAADQVYKQPYKQPFARRAADAIFRNWLAVLGVWALATAAVVAYAYLAPREYESEMTFLVNNYRAETRADGTVAALRPGDISDQQMSTEVQILSSRELIKKALGAAGFHGGTEVEQEKALAKLQKNLQVAPVLKANMIRVRYTAPNPNQATNVLEAIADAYPDEQVQLHRNPGQKGFFDQEAEDAEKKLIEAENRLVTFQKDAGIVSAADQKQMLLTRQIELQVTLHQAEAEDKEASNRLDSLKPRLEAMSGRIATQTRRVPNQYSVERMNTMLTELQNRRTELVSKYKPGERVVTQLDQQIADTKKALQAAEGSASTEEVSDVNPQRQALETELTRAEAARAGLAGKIQTMRAQDAGYREQLAKLETLAPLEQEYQRQLKVAESNYLLYAKKREEARITQSMDEQKMSDVVLAEQPRFEATPKPRTVMLGCVYALALAIGALLAVLLSRLEQTVDTPWALEEISSVPVLGTVPVHSIAIFSNRLQRQA